MFLRSKFEKKGVDGIINAPINLHHIECIGVEENKILFNSHDEMYLWAYKNESQRNQEYEWIISQLDCRVNDKVKIDNVKGRSQLEYGAWDGKTILSVGQIITEITNMVKNCSSSNIEILVSVDEYEYIINRIAGEGTHTTISEYAILSCNRNYCKELSFAIL